jgi:sugar phosphate isomerase/epimerase
MVTISYMGANLVAQQVNWSMTEGWDQGEQAASAFYAPVDTFRERFGAFVALVVASGFDTLDVWNAQLEWQWATDEHLATARELLDAAAVRVASYAGYFGATVEEFERAADVAEALGTRILSGGTDLIHTDRAATLRVLRERKLVLALENHMEQTPQRILELVGDDRDVLGTAADTGWWATQGVEPAVALAELAPVLVHVHLKDILAAGEHTTCALGDGIADIPRCLEVLATIGFDGPISIEHEPETFDPFDDVVVSRERLVRWLEDIAEAEQVVQGRA